ncbi:MAG TPA: 6-carboxytetrahydropterin synthase [Pirellulaceae bacterium]|nr:6-carboxytetrahydropterin synthase [Pirellulaceae bacterium]HMO91293.1 6-carboxytetrahydropterin synthase [Pirellulaceae bacterium]HMP68523.1 6-carboxytetrahydropterin synthase [Pirellulaceae bacterium]
MIELTREVRFAIPSTRFARTVERLANSWSGSASDNLIRPMVALQVTVAGELDSKSSYICNIKLIDDLVMQRIVNRLQPQSECTQRAQNLLDFAAHELQLHLPPSLTLRKVALHLNPQIVFAWQQGDTVMLTYSEQFEFSAAHRLHNPNLSDEENLALFGKCNHISGHGHNYVVDVTLVKHQAASDFDVRAFQTIVRQQVIDRLDHKHLNCDVAAFRELNPSVENIAKTIFDWLKEPLKPQKLHGVRVYETPKTWADYFGQDNVM